MRVSLDVTAVPAQPAGAGRYIYELANHLSDVDLRLLTRKNDARRWRELVDPSQVINRAPEARPLRLAWEQINMPRLIDRISADVHHGPHYTMPERARVPVVVTVHDMTLFEHPEWHEASKVKFFQRAINVAAKRAAALIAVSNDTAERLRARFGDVDVTVIPHGIDHGRFRVEADENDIALLRQFRIPDEFICFVGTVEPRKNVPGLLRAFDRIADGHREMHLVIAGQIGWADDEFARTLDAMKHRDRVVQTGFVPDALIPALLRNANVAAYPALMEGFGLPAVEALACGAPLLTTSGSAMEEMVDDAALLVAPGDDDAIASGLEALMTDHRLRQRLELRGPEVARRFTWQACARAHVEVYERAAKR